MPAHSLDDFPDRVHPMLVRELRARMNEPRLLATMIGAHLLLGLAAAAAVILKVDNIFFILLPIIAVLMMLVITFGSAGALRGELRRGNFQLLQLAGIDAAQLVRGKWIATASQLGLATVSLTPWVAFLGNLPRMNVFACLVLLVMLLATNLLLATGELWAATHQNPVAFWLARLAAGFMLGLPALQFLGAFGAQLVFEDLGLFRTDPSLPYIFAGLVLAIGTLLIWLGLGVSACQLSGETADFLFPHRLGALLLPPALLLTAWGLDIWKPPNWSHEITLTVCFVLGMLVVNFFGIVLLTERPPTSPQAWKRPLGLPRALRSLFGPLLYPGAPGALLIYGLGLVTLIPYPELGWGKDEAEARALILLWSTGPVLFNTALTRLFKREGWAWMRHRLLVLLVVVAASQFLLGFIVVPVAAFDNSTAPFWSLGVIGLMLACGFCWHAYAADVELHRKMFNKRIRQPADDAAREPSA